MNQKNQPPPYSQHNMPPPAGFAPPIMHTVPAVVPPVSFGPNSQHLMCPHCHAYIQTSIEMQATTKTHIAALIMCLFCCIPCAIVPYCMDSCQNTNHHCPKCRAFLGSYNS